MKMAEKLERTYNIPLRREFVNTPKYKRAKRAVSAVRLFLRKHMKSDNIKIGQELNKRIWNNGIKNPPHHVHITAVKEGDTVKAELVGINYKDTVKIEKKVDKKETLKDKLSAKLGIDEEKPEEKPEKEEKPEMSEKKKLEDTPKNEETTKN